MSAIHYLELEKFVTIKLFLHLIFIYFLFFFNFSFAVGKSLKVKQIACKLPGKFELIYKTLIAERRIVIVGYT